LTVKPIPYKYRPKGLTILYEDRDLIVINKKSGLLSVKAFYEKEKTAHKLLTNYIRKGNTKSRKQLYVVQRLDRETSGVLVFAKSIQAKDNLIRQWESVKKKYLAVVHGQLPEKSGTITSYLVENENYNVYSIDDSKRGKLARTRYKVIKETKRFSTLEIDLLTGRKNQIRVHFFELGHPVLNDDKYGKKYKSKGHLALHSNSITFKHPYSNKTLTFKADIPAYFERFLN
jgi:tRNA pseudouridine32 synthase/23S rRNA pseudouridine746 synthase/23S rRNA pseudouridine1911/1915/1917 synthase